MNNNNPNEPGKKRGCLYGCLTAIGIIIVLFILLGSCSSYMNSRNTQDENAAETVKTDESEYQSKDNTDQDIETNMLLISQYFTELAPYTPEYIDADPDRALTDLKALQEKITATVENIREIPLSRLQQYLISIAMNQNNACQNLIDYASKRDMTYYNDALTAMTRANEKVQEMNDYLTNNN